MNNKEAVNWLINITADIGKAKHSDLWHYMQALTEIKEMLESSPPEPCVDAISRQAAKLNVAKVMWEDGDTWDDVHDKCVDCLDDVSLVTPVYAMDEWCIGCKEYNSERHCCPRFNRVIREALEESRENKEELGENGPYYKYLDISTSHIKKETFDTLRRQKMEGIVSYPKYDAELDETVGVFVCVPDDNDNGDIPADLQSVFAYARRTKGCHWLNIDGDGDIIEALKVWDW